MKKIKIGDRPIGDGEPTFIIAEAGVNHNGDIELAKKLIQAAKETGADAIKFQTFKASSIVTQDAEKAEYQKLNTSTGTQYDMIKKLELTGEDFKVLKAHADALDIIFLSTPFDIASSDILDTLDIPAYKMASGEITNFPLLRHVAGKGKPIILSTGMAVMEEIKEAIQIIQGTGLDDIIVLHCITSYPAPMEDLNLKVLTTMMGELEQAIGYSDHSTGIMAPIAAVALGSCVIEKHFTLDRTMDGPDHAASLEPDEMAEMVTSIRQMEKALGNGIKAPNEAEKAIMAKARKSIVAAQYISAGSIITGEMLTIKRPGTGLHPRYLDDLIGKMAKHDIEADKLIEQGDIE